MGDRERRLGIAVLDLVFMGDLDRRVFSLALVPRLDLAGGGGEGVGAAGGGGARGGHVVEVKVPEEERL